MREESRGPGKPGRGHPATSKRLREHIPKRKTWKWEGVPQAPSIFPGTDVAPQKLAVRFQMQTLVVGVLVL